MKHVNEKDKRKKVLVELMNNKCNLCQQTCPYKKNYIQIKFEFNKFYVVDAFCSSCYKYYLEGFPWSTDINSMDFVTRLPCNTLFDIVEIEYY